MVVERIQCYCQMFMENQRRCNRGQGVIEYAGAMVMAAVMVSLVLAIFPNPFTDFFFEMVETIMTMIVSYLP